MTTATELPKILIVEDDAGFASKIKTSLSDLGYHVAAVASTGTDALQLTREIRPDLVLMDLHIQGLPDGLSCAAQIKAAHRIPVFYFTAYSEPEERDNTEGLDVFAKRSIPEMLQAMIDHYASERSRNTDSRLLLVVEDDPGNQWLISRQLAVLGHVTHAVANGREALEALSRVSYDLVLMDCQMPRLDGFDTTKLIREMKILDPAGNRIPIIAVTSHNGNDLEAKCVAAGMDGFHSKPLQMDQLQSILGRWFEA